MSKPERIHPAIMAAEKQGEDPVALEGWRGTSKSPVIRIHPMLSVATSWEVLEDDVVHCEELDDEGRVRLLVKPTATIRFARQGHASAFGAGAFGASAFGITANISGPWSPPPSLTPLTPLFPSASCARRCKERIRADGTNFTVYPGKDELIYLLNGQGQARLLQCLRRCGYSGRLLYVEFTACRDELEGAAKPTEDPDDPTKEEPPKPVGPSPA